MASAADANHRRKPRRFFVGIELTTETQGHREERWVLSQKSLAVAFLLALISLGDSPMDERDPLTQAVIGAAIEVHRHMGPGLLESVYQKCMEHEFQLRGIVCQAQAKLPLVYKGVTIGDDLKMDFFFPNQLVVELKAVEKIHPVHEAQLLSYMKLSKVPVGLLLNFNSPVLKEGLKRMVL